MSPLIYLPLAAVGIVALCLFAGWTEVRAGNKRTFGRPVICVCKVDSRRVGVALRDDLHRSSRKYWKRYLQGKERYDAFHIVAPSGHRIDVCPVYVFEDYSREYLTLVSRCYVEQATFHVPAENLAGPNPIDEACRYIFGRPFDGKFINW